MDDQTAYDIIAVLGYKSRRSCELPLHAWPRLKKVSIMYNNQLAKKIVVCGKWSIYWDQRNIKPLVTEAENMRIILRTLGVSDNDIIKEEHSKDTIGNAYYLKTKIVDVSSYKRILVSCADFHVERVRYIFSKVFGKGYTIDYFPTPTNYTKKYLVNRDQEKILYMQKKFLENMREGDHKYLSQKLYNDPFYRIK